MIKILKYELYKLIKLKKTYFFTFAINIFPLLIIFILLIIYLKGLIYNDLSVFQKLFEEEFKDGIITFLIFMLSIFSWFSWLFQSFIIAELVSKEFENKTIRLIFLLPFKRLTIFLGKILATVIFYLVNFLIYNFLCYLIIFLLNLMFNIKFLLGNEYIYLIKIYVAYFIINFSYITLSFLISLFVKSAEMLIGIMIFITFLFKAFDNIILLFGKLQIISESLADVITKYSYINTCELIKFTNILKYIENYDKLKVNVISFDLLGFNILYSLLFFSLAYYIFKNKEEN